MKKTFNINLAGLPFIIDEDAYKLLNDYLDTIRFAFKSADDTEELADDIEARIAEILYETDPDGIKIITLEEVSRVISRIGQPEEIIEIDESSLYDGMNKEDMPGNEEKFSTPPPINPQPKQSRNPFVRKKLFRDSQSGMLGGVCAGIAYYFNIDPTIVRLITVLLVFLSASTVIIVYIILWIVVPDAVTPYQRMQMKGTDPTVENIGKSVTEDFNDAENLRNASGAPTRPSGFLNSFFDITLKCLIILGLIITCPLLLALSIGLVGCMIAAFVIGTFIFGGVDGNGYGVFDFDEEGRMIFFILLAVIGGIITIGIPLWLLIRMLLKKNDLHQNSNYRKILLIVWLSGLVLTSIFTAKAIKASKNYNDIKREARRERTMPRKQLDEEITDMLQMTEFKDSTFTEIENMIIQTPSNNELTMESDTIPIQNDPKIIMEEALSNHTDSIKK